MIRLVNDDFKIRPIESKDNEGVYKLIQGILESYDLDKPGTAYFDPYLSELYEYYQKHPKAEYWVLVKDDKIFGGIGISQFSNYKDVAEVQKYYLSKDVQGLGYGRKLYNRAEEFAKKKGYKKLYIETIDTLGTANEVYHHFGFAIRDKPLSGSEHNLMNIWLEKDL